MIYIRGNPLDYDNWRDAYGCTGWGYADLLPYFLEPRTSERGGSAWHGTGRPLRVEDQRYEHPLSRAWLEAAIAWGLPGNEDFNGAHQDGAGHYQMTQRGGRRWSAADAYLRPAMARPNLTVETGAHVTRLLLAGERATGVRYLHHGTVREAGATREVVVACGAVKSPQLLLLSGIGPAGDLRAHDLPVVVDAPRGRGRPPGPPHGPGGLAGAGHPEPLGGVPPPTTWSAGGGRGAGRWRPSAPRPAASPAARATAWRRTSSSAPSRTAAAARAGPAHPAGGRTLVGAVHVRSRGRVTLASADPTARPLVDPAYFADEDDLQVLVAGVRMAPGDRRPRAAGEHHRRRAAR